MLISTVGICFSHRQLSIARSARKILTVFAMFFFSFLFFSSARLSLYNKHTTTQDLISISTIVSSIEKGAFLYLRRFGARG